MTLSGMVINPTTPTTDSYRTAAAIEPGMILNTGQHVARVDHGAPDFNMVTLRCSDGARHVIHEYERVYITTQAAQAAA